MHLTSIIAEALVVPGEVPVAVDPGGGPFHDLPLFRDDEALLVCESRDHGKREAGTAVATVSPR